MENEKSQTRCVYCNIIINDESEEHIIQNALGGLITSTKICCSRCNQILSLSIDQEFTSIFNPILGKFDNMVKTNNNKSAPSYTGKAIHREIGRIYNVRVKRGKIIDCPELKKEFREKYSSKMLNELVLIYTDFILDNIFFENGLRKIAFNYAVYSDVDLNIAKEFLTVRKEGDDIRVSFSNPIIPFMPLNPFDTYWELNRIFEPYHNLILFSQDDFLWCYVDLFNTFQYYVLISRNWNNKIRKYNSYMQLLKKLNRNEIDVSPRSLKDILVYSTQYGVPPICDIEKLRKNIQITIQKKSQQIDMKKYISNRFDHRYAERTLQSKNVLDYSFALNSLKIYMDEDDKLIEDTYKQVTVQRESSCMLYSYPVELWNILNKRADCFYDYGHKKFHILNKWLDKK